MVSPAQSLSLGLSEPPVTDLCQCMGRVMGMHAGIPEGTPVLLHSDVLGTALLCCRHERMHAGNPKGVVLSHSKVLATIATLHS